jgi:hypothetical protein
VTIEPTSPMPARIARLRPVLTIACQEAWSSPAISIKSAAQESIRRIDQENPLRVSITGIPHSYPESVSVIQDQPSRYIRETEGSSSVDTTCGADRMQPQPDTPAEVSCCKADVSLPV